MNHILIVEDEQAIAELLELQLTKAGYACTYVLDGEKAVDCLEQNHYDLVLLDIMLPKVDGYELMEYISTLDTPVIFITAKDAVKDRIKGLTMGADDYIVKPFDIGEVLARVQMVLRRYGKGLNELHFQDVTLRLSSRRVLKGNEEIALTPKEYDLLLVLVQNKNIVLYREELFEKVWETEYIGNSRTLDLHIQRLRHKLGFQEEIKTVFRIGYILEERKK